MLSIVIPTLNEEKYLPKLLKSIKRQDYTDYEVIVCDGNSRDKTQAIAKKLGAKVVVSDKKRVYKKDMGASNISFQRNLGASKAKGDVILFLDADIILPEHFLSQAMKKFKKTDADIASFFITFDSKKPVYRIYDLVYNFMCFLGEYIVPMSIGAVVMVSKKLHNELKGFDSNIYIGEDYEYFIRGSKKGKFKVLRTSKPRFSVRRIEKEGKIKMLFKWIYGGLYMIFKGPIRKDIVSYEFGEHDKD